MTIPTVPADTQPSQLDGWKNRRQVVRATITYCGIHLSWLTFWGTDTVLHQQLAYVFSGIGGVVITGYLGFAVWDDRNKMKFNQ